MLALTDKEFKDPDALALFNKAESIKQDIELIHNKSCTTDDLAREAYNSLIKQYKQTVGELAVFAPELIEGFLKHMRAEEEKLRIRIDLLFDSDTDISDMLTRHVRLCDVLAEFGAV